MLPLEPAPGCATGGEGELRSGERGAATVTAAAEATTTARDANAIAVLEQLIEAHPPAVEVAVGYLRQLPLHLACAPLGGGSASVGVVRRLIRAFPEAVQVADARSRLPLHLACGAATGAGVAAAYAAAADGAGYDACPAVLRTQDL